LRYIPQEKFRKIHLLNLCILQSAFRKVHLPAPDSDGSRMSAAWWCRALSVFPELKVAKSALLSIGSPNWK